MIHCIMYKCSFFYLTVYIYREIKFDQQFKLTTGLIATYTVLRWSSFTVSIAVAGSYLTTRKVFIFNFIEMLLILRWSFNPLSI